MALCANFKMYSRSAKGGEKGDPNRNPWLAKMTFLLNRKRKKIEKSQAHHCKFMICDRNHKKSKVIFDTKTDGPSLRYSFVHWERYTCSFHLKCRRILITSFLLLKYFLLQLTDMSRLPLHDISVKGSKWGIWF